MLEYYDKADTAPTQQPLFDSVINKLSQEIIEIENVTHNLYICCGKLYPIQDIACDDKKNVYDTHFDRLNAIGQKLQENKNMLIAIKNHIESLVGN